MRARGDGTSGGGGTGAAAAGRESCPISLSLTGDEQPGHRSARRFPSRARHCPDVGTSLAPTRTTLPQVEFEETLHPSAILRPDPSLSPTDPDAAGIPIAIGDERCGS